MNKLLLVLLLVLILMACSSQNRPLQSVVVLIDKSDQFISQPRKPWLQSSFHTNTQNSMVLSIETLDAYYQHEISKYELNIQKGLMSNKLKNIDAKERWINQVETALNLELQQDLEAPKSVIFPIIATHLSQDTIPKQLHVFSDLKDNSFVNLHKFRTVSDYELNKARITRLFKMVPVKKGNSIVCVYYQPKDYDDGVLFNWRFNFYKSLLEPMGYSIIKANLKHTIESNKESTPIKSSNI